MDDLNVTQPANNNSNEPAGLQEEWRWIPDERIVQNRYQVSNLGRVRNAEDDKILRLSVPRVAGYRIAVLPVKDDPTHKKRVGLYVHRLVAALFLPAPLPGQTQVDHIDGDRLNNRVDNLRWVSPRDNLMNPITRQHAKDTYEERAKKQYVPVICVSDNNREFASIKEAAEYYKIDPRTISASCKHYGEPRKRWVVSLKGQPVYRFRYANSGELVCDTTETGVSDDPVAYNAKAVVYMGDKETRWFPTIKAAANAFGLTSPGIARACNRHAAGSHKHPRSGRVKLTFRWATPEDKPQSAETQA